LKVCTLEVFSLESRVGFVGPHLHCFAALPEKTCAVNISIFNIFTIK